MASEPRTNPHRNGPNTAVVIASYNQADTLGAQLAALSGQVGSVPFEVIVVNNNSTDDTASLVGEWRGRNPDIRLVRAPARASAGYARNVGARSTEADYLLFTDSDDVVCDTWVSSMVEALGRYPAVGGVVDEETLNSPSVLAWKSRRSTDSLETAHSFLSHAIGTNLGIRRQVFEAVGGWAEEFPYAASEDIELSWRVQLAGHTLATSPTSIVKYRHRGSIPDMVRQHFRRGRNDQALCRAYADFLSTASSARPAREYGVAEVALSIAGTLHRTIYSIEARGSVLRQLSSGAGWMVEGVLFRLRGRGAIDDELHRLLARAVPADCRPHLAGPPTADHRSAPPVVEVRDR